MLHTLYHPITATPFSRGNACVEHEPAQALRPYIRCYWCTAPGKEVKGTRTLVIPDTCMDLIFHIDAGGGVKQHFCAMQEGPFVSVAGKAQGGGLFAIRFYPWAAALFAQESLRDTANGSFDARLYFPKVTEEIILMLRRTDTFAARCKAADEILMAHCDRARLNHTLMNAMHAMLVSGGSRRVSELARDVQLSTRQLERLFGRFVGIGPKALASMVRYQCVWREAAGNPRFDVQDAVYRYGYTDQAHLLRQFRAYHSLTLSQAVLLARGADVAFLQDNPHGA